MMGWMAPLRHLSAKLLSDRISSEWEPSIGEVTTIGLDLAKHVFQVHGVDAQGATVLRKQLRRAQILGFFSRLPRCLIGLEACATAQQHSSLLVSRLDRHKAHRRPRNRLADCFRIGSIVLVALDVRLHVFRRHQSARASAGARP